MNKQEKMWQSGFGTDYHTRNKWEDRSAFWADVLGEDVLAAANSVLEPGAGKGENLVGIHEARKLFYKGASTQCLGIEVNEQAYKELASRTGARLGAFLDTPLQQQYPLVITRGFLMHVPSAALAPTLAKLYNASSKYICITEYYSPVRREVEYHGQGSALWIDDFAHKIMEMYPDLKLIDYGFKYHKDNGYDLTYFVLEK